MPLSLQDWHNRFLIQAQWTKALRLYFFDLLRTRSSDKVLDMGCGTGALLQDLQSLSPAEIFGADISLEHLYRAQSGTPESKLTGADVYQLPFANNSFEVVLTHYFLMWIDDPFSALKEMIRVAKNDGYLVCFAEPDYGGRIDFPSDFNSIKKYQIRGLIEAGADPRMGRKLKTLFNTSGLSDVQYGIYEGRWKSDLSPAEAESEWQMLENDLKGIIPSADLMKLKEHDRKSRKNGSRIVYVPTFYAWGKVSK